MQLYEKQLKLHTSNMKGGLGAGRAATAPAAAPALLDNCSYPKTLINSTTQVKTMDMKEVNCTGTSLLTGLF